MRFLVFRDKKEEYRWSLKAENGKCIATSGQGYKELRKLKKTMLKIRARVHGAGIRFSL